jgi:helicase MOV-10
MSLFNSTYDNKLISRARPADVDVFVGNLFPDEPPLDFIHVEGIEMQEADSPSWKNEQEAELVVHFVGKALETGKIRFQGNGNVPDKEKMVILSPYRKQCEIIRKKLTLKFAERVAPFVLPQGVHNFNKLIQVCSVETYQGRQAKLVLLSCVRSKKKADVLEQDQHFNIGFLRQPKRMNVALSRAIAGLIVVANAFLLYTDPEWRSVINKCCSLNLVTDVTDSSNLDAVDVEVGSRMYQKKHRLGAHSNGAGELDEHWGGEEAAMPGRD